MSKDSPSAMSAEVLTDPIAEAIRQWDAHGWETASPGMAAVTTIVRVNRILVARVETALNPIGLSFARFEILRLLGFTRDRRLPMGKIGQRLQVHPASVTSAVKRLERDGMIRRRTAEHDNRVVFAELTPRGQELVDMATESINGVFEELELDPHDMELISGILGGIRPDE